MKKKITAAILGTVMAATTMFASVPVMAEGEQVLNIYRRNEPATLDRVAPTIDESGKYILHDASEPLVRIVNGETTEAGCESYEYDEENLTYTFKLRENYWEDGVQVKAADYLYSFQRMVDPDTAYGYVSDLYCIENAEAINAGEKDVSELGVSAPDDMTLVVKLNDVTPSFLEVVPLYPQRQDFVEQCGDSYGIDADKFLSCGPFKVTVWEHNSYIDMVPNEKYWDAENVKLEKVHVALTNDANTLYTSMLNGTLDYMETSSPEYIETFEGMDDLVVQDNVSPALGFIVFNCEDELMSNVKVRQAFSLAINRELFTEMIYHGLSYPAYGLLSSANGIGGVSFRDKVEEPLKAFAEEVEDPKALLIEGLTELGMDPDPANLTVTLSTGSTSASAQNSMAVFQQCFLETLGVTVESDATEWATFWNDCKGGDFQMAYLAWSGEVDVSFLFNLFLSNSAQMPCFYYTEEYDEIVEKANKSTDPEERFKLYGEAEQLVIVDQCQLAPVYYEVNRSVLRSKVKNWDYNVFSTAGRKDVYIEE